MSEDRKITLKKIDPRSPDIAELVRQLDALMMELYPAESAHLVDLESLAGPETYFIAAFVDGVAMGCGAIMMTDADYAEVKRVYVSPDARGLGLSKLIMNDLEDRAREAGLPALRLETGIHQPEALGLFERAGFTTRGSYGDYPADDPNSVFMEKMI